MPSLAEPPESVYRYAGPHPRRRVPSPPQFPYIMAVKMCIVCLGCACDHSVPPFFFRRRKSRGNRPWFKPSFVRGVAGVVRAAMTCTYLAAVAAAAALGWWQECCSCVRKASSGGLWEKGWDGRTDLPDSPVVVPEKWQRRMMMCLPSIAVRVDAVVHSSLHVARH
jgi:hypothetical protein